MILDDFDHILDAIYMYKKIFGDMKIPVKYEVRTGSMAISFTDAWAKGLKNC